MKIITKYHNEFGKLKILKSNAIKPKSSMRLKLLKNGKEIPCCDFGGDCTNQAYAEVYPFLMGKSDKKGWSYLCKKHYYSEQKRLNWKLPASLKLE